MSVLVMSPGLPSGATITSGITSFQYKVVMSFYLYDVIIRCVICEGMSHGTAVVQQSSCSQCCCLKDVFCIVI